LVHYLKDKFYYLLNNTPKTGITLLAAIKCISLALNDIADLNISHQSAAEKIIPISTLQTLIKSPNPNIAKAASTILLRRLKTTIPHNTISPFVDDLFSPSSDAREKAFKLVKILESHVAEDRSFLYSPKFYYSFIVETTVLADDDDANTLRAVYRLAKIMEKKGEPKAMQLFDELVFDIYGTEEMTVLTLPAIVESEVLSWLKACIWLSKSGRNGSHAWRGFRNAEAKAWWMFRNAEFIDSDRPWEEELVSDSEDSFDENYESAIDFHTRETGKQSSWWRHVCTFLGYEITIPSSIAYLMPLDEGSSTDGLSPEEYELRRRWRREAMVLQNGDSEFDDFILLED